MFFDFLTYNDIQHIIVIKLCFFLFLGLCLWGIYKRCRGWWFVFLVSIFSSFTYLVFVNNLGLPLWGLKGDEITITAMYEMMAHGAMFRDFAYPNLPAFYPPLWFSFFGLIGKIFSWNGIFIGKFAAASTFLLLPAVFYALQVYFWGKQKSASLPGPVAWLFSSLALFVVFDWHVVVSKPYEVVSACLIVLWTLFFLYDLWHKKISLKRGLVYSVTGGLLFMVFYFWFFLVALGITFFHLLYKRVSLRKYVSLCIVGLGILLVSAPFWYPLFESYRVLGSENWTLGYFLLSGVATHGPLLTYSISSLVLLFGLVSLIVYRKHFVPRILLSLFVAQYVWHIMGLVTLLVLSYPMQEAKGVYYFHRVVLLLGAAYGVERLWIYCKKRFSYKHKVWTRSVVLIGVCVLSTQLFFGFTVDDVHLQERRSLSRSLDSDMQDLISFLDDTNYPVHRVTLHSGISEISAFLPTNTFIYYNAHNSHPAARFSERLSVVDALTRMTDPESFFELTQHNGITPITRFIFFAEEEKGYPLYFHVDDFPHTAKEVTMYISPSVFSPDYFSEVYRSKRFVVYESNK